MKDAKSLLLDILNECPETFGKKIIQEIDWMEFYSVRYKLNKSFIQRYKDDVDWDIITNIICNTYLKNCYSIEEFEELCSEFKDTLNWGELTDLIIQRYELLDCIEIFIDFIDKNLISSDPDLLTEEFMRKYKDHLIWEDVLRNKILEEDFILEMKSYVLTPELIGVLFETQNLSTSLKDRIRKILKSV